MSNHDDVWETEMSREFDKRVRDLHEAPLTLDQVKGRAGGIRRTRRLTAAGGAIAAAAVIVPLVLLAGGSLTDDSGPDPAPDPDHTATDPSGSSGYLEGRTLHLADGSTRTLPERYDNAALLGDTVLGARNDDETGYDLLDVVDESGTVVESVDIVSGPVVNDTRTVAAYVETSGDLVVRWKDDQATVATGLTDAEYPVAVSGSPGCEDAECRVYVNGDWETDPLVYDSEGGQSVAVPGVLSVNDVSAEGLVTVQSDSSDTGSCGGVYDVKRANYVWQTCDDYLFDLSPGSQYVNGTHDYLDGIGNAYATILDASNGDELARFEPANGFVGDTAWQDSEHLLVTAFEQEGWSIYRLGADGTTERLVGPSTKGSDVDPAYALLD